MRRISPTLSSLDSEREQRLQTDTADDLFDSPEQALWYNVITQAITDSFKLESKNKYKRIDAQDAVDWLLHDITDFEMVCCRAGIDPENLRRCIWPLLHQKYPFSLRDGRIVSPAEKLKRKTEVKRRLKCR